MRAALWHRLPANFEKQLRIIVAHGFTEFHFDDGYDDVLRAARGVEAYDATATFFIVPGWVGLDGMATLHDLRRLVVRGHRIGNHTMHHAWMGKIPRAAEEREWEEADEWLHDELGVVRPPRAWPFGRVGRIGTARGIEDHEVFAPRDLTAGEVWRALT